MVANGRNWATSVTGSTNEWFETGNWQLASGRLFEPDEQLSGAAVCIVGETVRGEAHAWVECEDRVVIGGAHTQEYIPLAGLWPF